MKTSKYILALVFTVWCALGNLYAINSTYYSSIDGKKDSGLREALTTLVYNKHTTGLSYDWTFDGIDWDSNGNVYDIYSDCGHKKTDETGSYKCCCDAINREHIVPQSLFSDKTPQKTDRHHLYVVDGKVNGYRSNYAFGECSAGTKGTCGNASTVKPSEGKATCTNHEYGKLGTSTFSEVQISDKVYEPKDEYKGDIARAIMYMVIRYATTDQCKVGSGTGNLYPVTAWSGSSNCGLMFSGSLSTNYGLSAYGKALLLKWHRNDPVSAKEIARNDGVAAKQGNRNPFIDYPCLAEYLWGNKAGETVTLSELVGTFTGSWSTGDGCPCGTNPAITLPTGAIDCGSTSANTPITKTITVQGVNLTGNLTLGVSGGNSSLFSLNATTILKAAAEAGTTVNITYTPTSAGSHSTTLTIGGGGLASSRTISGTCCNPYTVTLSRNGITETIGACGTYTLPTAENEADPCDGWKFQGWITDGTSFAENQTKAPSYTSSVTGATTLYAVYAKTTTGAPRRVKTAESTATYTFKSKSWTATEGNWTSGKDGNGYGNSGVQVTTGTTGANATCPNSYSNITGITVSYCTNGNSGAGSIKMGVGSTEVTQSVTKTGGTTARNLLFDFSSTKPSGNPKITVTCSTNSIYVCGVTITYGSGSTSTTNYKKLPCTTYTISYSDADGIAAGGMYWADVTSALSGATVTLDNEPAKNYEFTGWTVTNTSTSQAIAVTNDQFTMPAANVTVKANFNALCTGELTKPNVTATPGNNKITLTWPNVTNATSYDVTIGAGVGYTTECSTPTIGTITNSGGTNTCVITGLVNGLDYTTSVVAQSTTYCDSQAEEDTTTPTTVVPTNVTVTFNANGGEGSIANQTIQYNKATNLTANNNSITRTGYTFQGWATSSTGAKVYNDGASVTLTDDITLFAVWQANKHSVTFSQPTTGGTFTVNSSSNSPVNNVDFGSTVTIAITPTNSHFTVTTVTVSGTGGSVTVNGSDNSRSFTMPDYDVTVSVTLTEDTKYTATFYNNGSSHNTQTTYAGSNVTKPGDPTPCDGFEFVGWAAATQATETTTSPTILTWPQTMPSNAVSYYAVFSRTESGSGPSTPATLEATYASHDGWTISGTGGSSYWILKEGASITSPVISDLSTVTSITFDARTYGGSSYKTVNVSTSGSVSVGSADASSTSLVSKTINVSGLTGSGSLVFSSSTTSSANGPGINNIVINYSTGGGGTTYYTTSCADCTNKVTLAKGAETNGTFTLSKSNGEYNNCSSNFTVTVSAISVTDPTNYRFKDVTANGGHNTVTDNGDGTYTVTYEKGYSITSTVTANFETIPSHTVTWSENGDNSNQVSYKEGASITFPNNASGCDDKIFKGWSATTVDETDTEPTYVTSATMGTSDITYYAVFADENSGGGSGAFDGSSAGTYKIYALVGSTKNYATGSISNGKMSSTTDESQAANFTFESVTDGLAIKTGTTYITYSSSTNLGTSSNAYAWTFASGTKGTWRVNSGTSGRGWIFRDGTGFGGYATNNVTAGGNEYYDLEIVGEGAGTSYSGYTTSCVTPTEVTVKFDANGGTGTMTDQDDIPYNTPTALKKNTFTRDGYTFQGWATSASGEKVYDDEEVVTLKRKVTTLYAVWAVNSYNISITQPKDGTISTGTISTSPAGSAACGASVTVSISNVNSHYDFSSFTVTKAGGGTVALTGSGTSQTFTMPASNVTVTATLTKKTTYIVTWSADGDESNKVEYIQGENIAFPSSAEGCGDKTFVGWSATQFPETDDVPSFVTSATMGTSNLIYYAVYADAGGSGGGSGDYVLVESDPGAANWEGDYLVAYSSTIFADGRKGGTDDGCIGKQYVNVNPGENLDGKVVAGSWGDTYNITLEKIGATSTYLMKTKDGKYNYYSSNNNGLTATSNKSTAEDYPLSITFNSSSDIAIAISAGAVFHYNTQQFFRFYKNGGQSAVYLYKKGGGGGSYSGYTTTCGPGISAKSGQWLTSANGQKVKTEIRVSAKNFAEATTLAATSSNGNFTVSLAETAVPGTKAGLTTTMTVEYTPSSADVKENATITLTAGDVTKTITVNGRSLPEQFLLIVKKSSDWYALPANMTKGAGEYDGVAVTPDNSTTPTSVAVAPSTVAYALKSVANARYAAAGNYVRLVGNNNTCLWTNSTTDITTIQDTCKLSESNGTNHEWELSTTDGVRYTIANPHHPDYAEGRRLAYGSKFGLYKAEAVFYIVPAGCSTKPTNVVTVARRTDVNFSWNSSAAQMKIDVYSNEGMSTLVKSETVEASPHLMDGLEQETDYWYRLTPVGDDACAVTGSFRTNGPTIEVVEWKEDAVVVYVDIDEGVNPKVIIDGEQEHGLGSGVIATELFFSKYFEGAGNMKLVSIYNGTTHNISLANYKLYTKNCSTPDNETQLANSSFGSTTEYPINTLGTIKTGQEIVFFTRPDAPKNNSTDAEKELYNCSNSYLEAMAAKNGADENPRWIECKDGTTFPAMKFNGNDAICLEKNETLIDVIGSTGTPGKSKNCANRLNDVGWPITVKNIDYQKASNDESFDVLFAATSKPHTTEQQRLAILAGFNVNLEDEEINLYTARCILFRDKNVTSGEKAVALNTGADFVTAGNHTYQGQNYSTEWNGRYVCMTSSMQTAAGVESDSKATCNSYHELGVFDYSEYYTDWNTISDDKTLDQFETETEGLYQIPVDELSQYSCLNLRFQLVKDEVLLTEAPVQVPIFVTDERTTADPIFTEIMKTESTHEPLYPESVERCRTCGVLVLGTGTLTKDNTGAEHDISEVGNLTLYPGGKLVVPNSTSLTASSITCRVEKDNVPVTDLKGNLITKDNQLTVTRRIRNDRYYFFSLPYDCLLKDVQWADGTQAEYGVDYLILEYDGETRAEEGSYVGWPGHWKNIEDGIIHAGKGYNIGVSSSTPKELVFPMAIGGTNLTEAEHAKYAEFPVDMKEYFGQYTAIDDNWNLIAHPYLTKIDCTPTGDAAVDVEWETCTSCEREADDPTQQIEPKSGTLEDGGATWQVTANGELIITGDGHFPDYGSSDQTPWAYARDKIKSVKISGSIVRIGNCAFANFLSLKTVVIASPVTQIATQVFANCSTLVSINIERPAVYIIDVAEDAFLGFDDTMLKGITLSVPGSLYDEYYNGTSTSSQSSIWKKMTLMKVEDSSTSGDGTTTNPAPQRIEPRRTIDPNPESGVLYVNIPYEITKSDGTKSVDYETATPISSITDIPPFTAVFIQGVGRGQMTFTKSESGSHAPWRRSKASITGPDESIFVGVTIHGNGQSDGAALRLRPDFHPGYKAGFDLTKLMQFYTPRPRIYMMSQNTRLSFLAISDDDAKYLWQPVGVYAYEPGTYTIALSDKYPLDQVAAVYLRDAQTGVITNLMHGNYTIETTKQLYTNTRFSIRVMLRREEKVDTPTFIEPVDNPNAPHKFIRDGLMYIMRDGKVYDLTGTPVQDKNIMLNH